MLATGKDRQSLNEITVVGCEGGRRSNILLAVSTSRAVLALRLFSLDVLPLELRLSR